MPLKVFGTTLYIHEAKPAPNGNRQCRAIVATSSQKKAAEAFGISMHEFRGFACPTGNAEEIEAAMARPGVVLWCQDRYPLNGKRVWQVKR
jgi:hypothetical protein